MAESEPEFAEVVLTMQIKPEVKELLADLREKLGGIDASLKTISASLAESLHEFFEVSKDLPGFPEGVITQEKAPPAGAED